MAKFGERLKEVRSERGISQLTLAKEFCVDRSTISAWEIGKQEPNYDVLVKLSKFFDVSTDYLLGIKDF